MCEAMSLGGFHPVLVVKGRTAARQPVAFTAPFVEAHGRICGSSDALFHELLHGRAATLVGRTDEYQPGGRQKSIEFFLQSKTDAFAIGVCVGLFVFVCFGPFGSPISLLPGLGLMEFVWYAICRRHAKEREKNRSFSQNTPEYTHHPVRSFRLPWNDAIFYCSFNEWKSIVVAFSLIFS